MNVLVTGASGLIGGRLIAALSLDGANRVRAASRRVRAWAPGIEGVVIDVQVAGSLPAACQGMDVVVNLAAMSEAECAADPDGALQANSAVTQAVVGAAISAGVPRFVQLSTYKVYGNNPIGVITEGTVTRPESVYARNHCAAEATASVHPNAVVLRLSNGFGAPARAGTPCWSIIVNDFCRQAVTTRRIAIRSDGLAWRNFIPLSDVVHAIGAAAKDLPPGTYNAGSAHSMSIRAMAERTALVCKDTLGYRPAVTVGASANDAVDRRLEYRSDRLREAGVILSAPIEEEIARTLLFAREEFGADV